MTMVMTPMEEVQVVVQGVGGGVDLLHLARQATKSIKSLEDET